MHLHKISLALNSVPQFAVSKTVHTKQLVSCAQTRLSQALLNDISIETDMVMVFWNVMPHSLLDT